MVTTNLYPTTSPVDTRQEFLAQQLPKVPASFIRFEKAAVEQTIHAHFEGVVERFPDKIAVKTPDWSLTYQHLNKRANQIAHALINAFGPEPAQVGFMLPNDGSAIPTILGILKSGKTYVPLDPLFPKERLAYMMADAQVSILLATSDSRELAKELGDVEAILNLDDLDPTLPTNNPGIYSEPLSVAYILYTSGSTGQPKGIAFAHRNLLHTTMCLVNSLRISPEDSLTLLHSTSFSSSVVDIYCALTTGATVYPWDIKVRGFAGLADWLRSERVTSFQWIPTPFRHFTQTLQEDETLPDIRIVVMASEPLTAREMRLHRRHFASDSVLVNQMGTSESYNYNLQFIDHNAVIDSYIMPAGYSVSEDREVLLLDEDQQPVDDGEAGEIAIQTEYMSLGYWQKPELTAEKFLLDPSGGDKKIYLTGDLGRKLPDGSLIHEGRKDFQVKIRGYRIEIDEIEKALNNIPSVKDAVVIAADNPNGEKQLVAYIIPAGSSKAKPASDASPSLNGNAKPHVEPHAEAQAVSHTGSQANTIDVDAIKAALAERLPDYMIPAVFQQMDAFPVTVTGKMDRMRLPEPIFEQPTQQSEAATYTPAKTETERRLVSMWSKLLGRDSIGIHDRFFELGGHSLIAARMFFEIERDLGVRIPLSTLFHAQTISELAQVIDGDDQSVSWSSLTPIQPNGSKPPLFIIHAHGGNVLGYYELAQYLAPDQPFYGLQAKGLDGISLEPRTFEEMAAAYVEEIRSLQPQGPYYLSGYCFGGNMAFAMSQQLRQAGEEVAFLAMVESGHQLYPNYPTNRSFLDKLRTKLFGRLGYELHSATKDGLRSIWPHVSARLSRIMALLQIKGERLLDKYGTVLGIALPPSQAYIQDQLEQIHDRAFHGYTVEPYDGDVLLFRAEHQPAGIIKDDTMGWGDSVRGKLDIYELAGYPVGILDEPRVQDLARIFNEHLEKAQKQHQR